MGKVVVIPTCDDSNRGDQALVWGSRRIASRAGIGDEFYMVSDSQTAFQTVTEGFKLLTPILRHPEKRYKPASNLKYGPVLLIVWGIIALFDLVRSALYLTATGRLLFTRFLSVDAQETLRIMQESNACVVKGGGFIHSTGSVTDSYRAYYSLFHVYLAQSLGRPVYVMPNSFGPFDGSIFCWLVKRALRNCCLVTARESISQNMLSELGVESELFPDLAFSLEGAPRVVSPIAAIREVHPPEAKIVGITVRPYRFPGSINPTGSYRAYISEMAQFATWLAKNGYVPIFVEHVLSSGAHESDMTAIESVRALLPAHVGGMISDSSYDCRDLMSIYGECDYVVGTRFHSVIFALTQGTPALAVAYGGNKGRGIMKDIGLPEFVIDIEDFSEKRAVAMFEKMVRAEDLPTTLLSIRDQARAAHEELVSLIREGF